MATRTELRGELVYMLNGVATPDECREFIALSEEIGYEDAPITTSVGFRIRKNVRNNMRVMIDRPDLAERIWDRVESLIVPASWWGRHPVGLNERFRFYRYEPGQRFAPHSDGYYERDNGERSELTMLLYLNEEFEGGETAVYGPQENCVRPSTGSALVFHHPLLHEGVAVTRGVKYVMRTDVMYSAN